MQSRTPWTQLAVDTGLAALVLVIVGGAITADLGSPGAAPAPAAYAFGALFAALMFVRRRWPVATLVITAIGLLIYYWLQYPPIGLAAPVAAALFSAAEQGRTRWAIGTGLVLLTVSTTVRLGEGDDPAFVLGYEFASSAGLMAAVIAFGDSVRARRGWRAELSRQTQIAQAEKEREAAHRIEQERLRIARDLHDVLSHTVSVIALHTDVARETLRDDPGRAEQSLTAARSACSDVTGELRATMGALRNDADEGKLPTPGLHRLDDLTATAREAGLNVTVHTCGSPRLLPAIADAVAYRVVQESLSNVLRHAGARNVHIELEYRQDSLSLAVRDDGGGAPPGADTGWGILGMRERLALLGGSLTAASPADGGFVVRARVPLQEQP